MHRKASQADETSHQGEREPHEESHLVPGRQRREGNRREPHATAGVSFPDGQAGETTSHGDTCRPPARHEW